MPTYTHMRTVQVVVFPDPHVHWPERWSGTSLEWFLGSKYMYM